MKSNKTDRLKLKSVLTEKDIPKEYKSTPIQKLLRYHNLNRPLDKYEHAELGIIKCIDNRERLNIPSNFAFIIRTAGAKIHNGEFNISSPVALNNIRYFAIIGHTDCAMVSLLSKRNRAVRGLAKNAGWSLGEAERHFLYHAPVFQTESEVSSVYSESKRLKSLYPKVNFVPMIYKVKDHLLYLVQS